jgi:hypothetical protein
MQSTPFDFYALALIPKHKMAMPFYVLQPLLGLIFNPQKCLYIFVDWDKACAGLLILIFSLTIIGAYPKLYRITRTIDWL